MYCPKCGKENDEKQRYCRACGLGLQTISGAMATELATPRAYEPPNISVQAGGKGWRNPLLYGFLLLLAGLTIIVIGKKVFGEQLVADIGTAMAIAGVVLFVIKGVSLMKGQTGSPVQTNTASHENVAALDAKSTRELPPSFSEVTPSSVTEHTTRHFEPIPRERKTD